MQILDLTSRWVNLVARGLLRFASWLRPEQLPEMTDANEDVSEPPADWLERTRNIPPEFWLDFLGPSGIDETSADLKPEQTETKANQIVGKSAKNLGTRAIDPPPNETATPAPTRRSPSKEGASEKSPFLRFSPIAADEIAESVSPKTSPVRYYTKSERLSQLRPHSEAKTPDLKVVSVSHQPGIRNQKQPKIEKRARVSTRSGQVDARSAAPTTPNRKQDLAKKLNVRSQKPSDRPEVKTAPGRIEYSDPQVALNGRATERSRANSTNLFTQTRFDHRVDDPFPIASTHFEQDEKTSDSHTKGLDDRRNQINLVAESTSVFVEAPWVALPDDFLPRSFEAGESSRSLTEHLLLLEREQAGNI